MTSYVGLGIPYIAFRNEKLWMDSGFLTIYDLFMEFHEQFGWMSYIYLDKSFQPFFDAENDPAKTGIYPLYSTSEVVSDYCLTQMLDDALLSKFFLGEFALDYILVNNYGVMPSVANAFSYVDAYGGLPIIYAPLNAGKDGVRNPGGIGKNMMSAGQEFGPLYFPLCQEAMSYFSTKSIIWSQEDQRNRGISIAKRFFTGSVVRRISEKGHVIGYGLQNYMKKYCRDEDSIINFLQKPKDDFFVSFIGRSTYNKNAAFIFDTMFDLFARHGIRLSFSLKGGKALNTGTKFSKTDSAQNMHLELENSGYIKSREDYIANKLSQVQCMFYASIAEGHNMTIREACIVGIPVLLPDTSWAKAVFGPDYPFYYKNEEEVFALILRIQAGKVSDEEVELFLKTRSSKYISYFISDQALLYKQVIDEMFMEKQAISAKLSTSILNKAFEESCSVGEEFTLAELIKRLVKAKISLRPKRITSSISKPEVFWLLRKRIEPVRIGDGLVRRIN